MRKQFLVSTVTIVLLLSVVVLVAYSQTFTVPAFQQTTFNLSLNQGDYVSGDVNVSGGIGNDINFYITAPNGDNVVKFDRVTQTSFSFTAPTRGTYTMHFDNSIGLLSKSVTVDYRVKASVLGIPQDLFAELLSIIIVIVAIIVAAFLILTRRRND